MHFELCNNCTQYVLDPGLILQGSVLVLVLGLGTKVLGLGLGLGLVRQVLGLVLGLEP